MTDDVLARLIADAPLSKYASDADVAAFREQLRQAVSTTHDRAHLAAVLLAGSTQVWHSHPDQAVGFVARAVDWADAILARVSGAAGKEPAGTDRLRTMVLDAYAAFEEAAPPNEDTQAPLDGMTGTQWAEAEADRRLWTAEDDRIRRQLARVRDTLKHVIPASEHPSSDSLEDWLWQLRTLADDRKACYAQRDRAEKHLAEASARLKALSEQLEDLQAMRHDAMARAFAAGARAASALSDNAFHLLDRTAEDGLTAQGRRRFDAWLCEPKETARA